LLSSLKIPWKGVLKPRHFLGVRGGEKIDLHAYVEASQALENALRIDHRSVELGAAAASERLRAELDDKLRAFIGARRPDGEEPNYANASPNLGRRISSCVGVM
jgi:hypothetical protein